MYLFYFCKRVTSLAVGFIEIHCPENHLFKEEHLTLGDFKNISTILF